MVEAEPASASVLDEEDWSVDDSVGDSVVDAAEDSASVGEAVYLAESVGEALSPPVGLAVTSLLKED